MEICDNGRDNLILNPEANTTIIVTMFESNCCSSIVDFAVLAFYAFVSFWSMCYNCFNRPVSP